MVSFTCQAGFHVKAVSFATRLSSRGLRLQEASKAAEIAELQHSVEQLQQDKQAMLRTLVATEIELQRAASKPSSGRCSAEASQQVPNAACAQCKPSAGRMELAPCDRLVTTGCGPRPCCWCTAGLIPANKPG